MDTLMQLAEMLRSFLSDLLGTTRAFLLRTVAVAICGYVLIWLTQFFSGAPDPDRNAPAPARPSSQASRSSSSSHW